MKNSKSNLVVAIIMLLSFTISNAQIKNATTENVKIYGNCGMCKTTIEKAGNLKKVATVDWDKDTQMATLTYDAKKTSQDEILKRIALAGYDSDKFLAPDDVYENLHGCCQYDRVAKIPVKEEMKMKENHSNHTDMTSTEITDSNQLDGVYKNYFALKDALVKTDGEAASKVAKALFTSINSVEMGKLEMDVHAVWMKVLTDLKADAKNIADAKEIAKQRNHFITLSKNMYALMSISKTETPTYYQFCPMANDGKGANWLSKENTVKNPYYGSKMMSCGKTVEIIK